MLKMVRADRAFDNHGMQVSGLPSLRALELAIGVCTTGMVASLSLMATS